MFVQSVQVGHRGHFLFCLPLTLDDHIFCVRTPFGGVLRLYGKPIESRLFPCDFVRYWESTTLLKIYVLVQVILLCRFE